MTGFTFLTKKKLSTKNTRFLSIGLVVVFAITFFVVPNHAFAQTWSEEIANAFLNVTVGMFLKVVNLTLNLIQMLVAGLLGIAGLLLDLSITYSITDLATHIADLKGINTAWKLIRDLCNMSFIFILLYNGIMTIFTSDNKAKKIIVPVIIAALLINFSLFFTKVIIDASNIVAISFYNSVMTAANGGTQVGMGTATVTIPTGLGGALMKSLNLTSLFSTSVLTGLDANTNYKLAWINLGSIAFMLVAAFVFLAMTVLFFIRYIAFVFLLVISPLGFMASVIPGLRSTKERFWNTLLGQAYFAPLFMIMMWIILTIISPAGGGTFLSNGTSLADALKDPNAGSINIIFSFILVIGFLILAMIVSKDQATKGGFVTTKMIDVGTGFLGGAMFGTAAWAGRNTIGKRADAVANNQELKDRAATGDRIAQMQLASARKLASATFDARKGPVGGNIVKATGVNFGKGSIFNDKAGEGGYEKFVKDKAKKETEYAKSLAPTDEVTKQAKEELKKLASDEAFIMEEAHRKDQYLNGLDNEINRQKKEIDFDVIETERMVKENAVKKNTQDLINNRNVISKLNAEYSKLAESDTVGRQQKMAEINRETANQAKIQNALNEDRSKLSEIEKKLEPINTLLQTKNKAEKAWVSPELQKTIERAGGSKANRDEVQKFGIQQEKDDKNKKAEDLIQSAKNANIESYATSIETTGIRNNLSNYLLERPTKLNKRVANEVRKELKAKSANEKLADVVKEMTKDDGAQATPQAGAQASAQTPTTPAPTAGGNPTP